jgi:hypothetical protein
MLYGFVLLVCRLLGVGLFGIPVVNGYTSTIVCILFLGGIQLVSVGILGEYIGRIYDEVKRRPLFLIRRQHQSPAAPGTGGGATGAATPQAKRPAGRAERSAGSVRRRAKDSLS